MSDSDSPSRRRPPTIDLTAQEVKTGEAAGSNKGEREAAQKSARRPFAGAIVLPAIAALAGAVVTAVVVAALWMAGIIPSRDSLAPPRADKTAPDITEQLNKIERQLQTRAPAPDPALIARLAALEAQTKTLGDSMAALNRRLDDIAVAAKSAGERADAASAAAKQTAQSAQAAAQSAVQRSDLEALQNRIAALERQISALGNATAQRPPGTNDHAARAALAAAALRATVERGAPYQAELAAVKALGTPQAATAPLEPFAASGIASAADLAHELAQLTPSLQRAAGAPAAKTSFLARLEDNAKNLVHVTPIDAPAGDAPSAVIARLNADAAHADLAAALADLARLPQAAQTLAAPWVQKVNTRNTALAAARRIAADALAALGKADSP
jgi:hypothetical protein